MMDKLSDFISEGKLTQDGARRIEELITQNKKLKEGFAYRSAYYNVVGELTTVYTKEDLLIEGQDALDKKLKMLEKQSTDYHKLKGEIAVIIDNNWAVRTRKLWNILINYM